MKKIQIAAGILLLICLGGLRAASPQQKDSQPPQSDTIRPVSPGPTIPKGTRKEDLRNDLIKQLIVMILFISFAGGAVWWAAKRFRTKQLTGPHKQIRISESVSLGPRKMLHIVEAGSKKLLVAHTADRITLLSDLTEKAPAAKFSIPDMEDEASS